MGVGALLLLIAACGEVGSVVGDIVGGDIGGSGQCGGGANTGSCLRIESIKPQYSAKDSSNVDVIRDVCNISEVNKDPETAPKFEIFTDHNAQVSLSNRPLSDMTASIISDITLVDYSITYAVNRCPGGNNCPETLPPLLVDPGQTILVKKNEAITVTLPFVPLATKAAYNSLGGPRGDFPSYTATYTLRGTDSFKNPVSVTGSAEFTIGSFDNCAG
jgi:hypothetical protein